MEDVTERRAADQLQQDFVSLVSHEMGNALTLITSRLQYLQRHGICSADALTTIVDQAHIIDRLVSDLSETPWTSDALSIHPRRVDIIDLVRRSVLAAQLVSPHHTVLLDCQDGRLEGRWDRGRLIQVLSNSLSNAIEYLPAGGAISVSIEDLGEAVCVSIRDNGIGIATSFDTYLIRATESPRAPARSAELVRACT
jgi:signal transduction histidine kinase